MTAPPAPKDDVSAVLNAAPPEARACLSALRDLIFEVAAETPSVGPLTETLKWGEPSYAPATPRIGTAVRIAWKPKTPDTVSLFVNCKTSLLDDWRGLYGDVLNLIGNREIALPLDQPLPTGPLTHCIAMALTYNLKA